MSTVYADTLEPTVPTKNTTLGATGDSITIGANSINTNVIQDSGGNVIFQSDGSGTLSNVNSAFSADLKLLSTQTASGSAGVEFTSGLDSTYDLYIFKWINVDFASNTKSLYMQASTDGGSSYGVTATNTVFEAEHQEDGSNAALTYMTGYDSAQSTSALYLTREVKDDADANTSGELHLFTPSNTTYIKHWFSKGQVGMTNSDRSSILYTEGYYNTTSAINAIKFYNASANISGTFKLYGL